MTTATTIDLSGFIGSAEFYAPTLLRHRFVCTEGMRHLCEQGEAHWILDLVASYLATRGRRLDAACDGFQLWQLRKLPEGSKNTAEATCWTDTPGPRSARLVRQLIPYTDFPFDAVGETFQFYVCGTGRHGDRWTAMLKSEY